MYSFAWSIETMKETAQNEKEECETGATLNAEVRTG